MRSWRELVRPEKTEANAFFVCAGDVPAGACLEGFHPEGKESVTEDGIVLGSYGLALSLIWIHREI